MMSTPRWVMRRNLWTALAALCLAPLLVLGQEEKDASKRGANVFVYPAKLTSKDKLTDGKQLVGWVDEHCAWDLEIVKRSDDVKGFKLLPKRWVSERTFGWLNKYRLLSKEYEVLIESSAADIYLAMTQVMVRRLAPEYAMAA